MKKKINILILLFLFLSFYSYSKDTGKIFNLDCVYELNPTELQQIDSTIVRSKFNECKKKNVLIVLEDEPAYIQKGCYNYFDEVDSFSIVLLNQLPDINYYVREVYPLEGIPEKFRIDNLYVLISGNILDCEKINSCTPPPPNAGYSRTPMLELKTIKINERGECSKWDNTDVLAVLKDEPAYLRRGCFQESNLFYIELVNKPYGAYKNSIYPCNGIPEEFRIDSLPVLVSGDILRSAKWTPCDPSSPNIRVIPTNIFELKTIKMNER